MCDLNGSPGDQNHHIASIKIVLLSIFQGCTARDIDSSGNLRWVLE